MTNNKIKDFLSIKAKECEIIITKYKKKYKIIKITYYTLITTSVIASTAVSIMATTAVPPLCVGVISGCAAIITALSIKFNIEKTKIKLNKKIQYLNKIKDKLDYVISCNGDLGENECISILDEFRDQ